MSRVPLIVLAMVAVAVAIELIGKAFDLSGAYYLVAFVVGLFVVSLTDRDRFYARDWVREQRRHQAR